jgi:hypothetical protein
LFVNNSDSLVSQITDQRLRRIIRNLLKIHVSGRMKWEMGTLN